MSLSQQITSLKTLLDQAESEIKSLEGGRKASAARARKSLQGIKSSSHGLRKLITEHTRALPVKTRKGGLPAEPAAQGPTDLPA